MMRIQWTRLTVKALQKRLQKAYSAGDKRLVRRLSDLLAVGQHKALIEQEFDVTYNRFYVCTLLKNLGYSFQKAQFVSDHLDEEKRKAWLEEVWPRLLRQARQKRALTLFVDEASFAQWGSLSYTCLHLSQKRSNALGQDQWQTQGSQQGSQGVWCH